jgi:4-hydroxy-tetrahydrodipicolinate synthase
MKKLYGVTTAMVTPFDTREQVDYGALRNMVDFLIERGVHCLYPCGTTGEMLHLTVEERKRIARTVVERADGRVTVYVHAGAVRQEETLELAAHAHAIGADGIGVVTPAYLAANGDEMVSYYVEVARAVPEDYPVYLYNIPQCTANDLTADMAVRIARQCPNVIGIKYSEADMLRTDEYLQVSPGFSVMQGADRLFLACLAMGCDGTVSGVSNVYPEPFVALYDAFRNGDLAMARQWQRWANLLCVALRCGSNMSYFKKGLDRRGVAGGHMRRPQLDLSQREIDSLYRQLDEIEDKLPPGALKAV